MIFPAVSDTDMCLPAAPEMIMSRPRTLIFTSSSILVVEDGSTVTCDDFPSPLL